MPLHYYMYCIDILSDANRMKKLYFIKEIST